MPANFADRLQNHASQEDLCLLVDSSSSMDDRDYPPSRLQAAIAAACALVEVKAEQYPADRIAVASFADHPAVHHQLAEAGPHADSIKRSIHQVKACGCTDIAAGLRCAGSVLSDSAARNSFGWLKKVLYEPTALPPSTSPGPDKCRRVLILSDGEHNASSKSDLFATAARLKKADVVIAAIGIGGSPGEIAEDDLKKIASPHPVTREPLYCFIADTHSLIREFKRQAHHICRVKEE